MMGVLHGRAPSAPIARNPENADELVVFLSEPGTHVLTLELAAPLNAVASDQLAAFGLSGCSYNELTAQQQQVTGKWANVESAMQRRADLIPNLVETAKMTGIQEQEVFGQIADARSRLLAASSAPGAGLEGDKSPEQKQAVIDANNSLGGVIGRLLSLQESYP